MSTFEYLESSANFAEFSSSVEIPELERVTKLDLANGITIAELVFWCCFFFPKKEALRKLIGLGKQIQTEDIVIKRIFEFQHQNGFSCLMCLFQMATVYRYGNKNKLSSPSGLMMCEIEESCLFLIGLAESANLDLNKILNHTTKNGLTLFYYASLYSERVTKHLLERAVKVNSISDSFLKPCFTVRLFLDS